MLPASGCANPSATCECGHCVVPVVEQFCKQLVPRILQSLLEFVAFPVVALLQLLFHRRAGCVLLGGSHNQLQNSVSNMAPHTSCCFDLTFARFSLVFEAYLLMIGVAVQ